MNSTSLVPHEGGGVLLTLERSRDSEKCGEFPNITQQVHSRTELKTGSSKSGAAPSGIGVCLQ